MKHNRKLFALFTIIAAVALIASCAPAATSVKTGSTEKKAYEIAVVVKIVGIPWFNVLEDGVKKAAKELGVNAYVLGPTAADPAQQVKIVEDLVAKGVDAIVVVPNDASSLVPVFKKAHEKGIVIITNESPGQEGADYDLESIDQDTYGIGMFNLLVKHMGTSGEYAVMIGSLTVPLDNHITDLGTAWMEKNYPNIKLATPRIPCAEDQALSREKALELIKAYPNLKGIIGVGSLGPIGSAQAVREKGLQDKITVVGASVPSEASDYFKDGSIDELILWSPSDSGYGTVWLAKYILDGNKPATGVKMDDGKTMKLDGNIVVVDSMAYITKDNVDSFGF